jgi:hypothetical protein
MSGRAALACGVVVALAAAAVAAPAIDAREGTVDPLVYPGPAP